MPVQSRFTCLSSLVNALARLNVFIFSFSFTSYMLVGQSVLRCEVQGWMGRVPTCDGQ